eukprot:TRINITY_DN1106_c0_g1_i2.p1 TRINITY_DN1106_c0_g1~~TRINITY_DN1106_c0_g1_i2.p1  ORF type:complete len:189 (+),score=58.19 TRINITY_DN1106_c0_g1_i2:62-568(+)
MEEQDAILGMLALTEGSRDDSQQSDAAETTLKTLIDWDVDQELLIKCEQGKYKPLVQYLTTPDVVAQLFELLLLGNVVVVDQQQADLYLAEKDRRQQDHDDDDLHHLHDHQTQSQSQSSSNSTSNSSNSDSEESQHDQESANNTSLNEGNTSIPAPHSPQPFPFITEH